MANAKVMTPPHQSHQPLRMKKSQIDSMEIFSQTSDRRLRRIISEVVSIANFTAEAGWEVGVSSFDTRTQDTICYLTGPISGPYNGGIFYVRVHFGDDYPHSPPIIQMMTRTYHPSIDAQGRICFDRLYDSNWCPADQLGKIMISISALLDSPDVEGTIVPEIAEQYLFDRNCYNEHAQRYTLLYATGEVPVVSDFGFDGRPWWDLARISTKPQDEDCFCYSQIKP